MMAAGGTRGRMIRRTLLLVVVIAVAGADGCGGEPRRHGVHG